MGSVRACLCVRVAVVRRNIQTVRIDTASSAINLPPKVDESGQENATCKKSDTSLPLRRKLVSHIKVAEFKDVTQRFGRIICYNTVHNTLQNTKKQY